MKPSVVRGSVPPYCKYVLAAVLAALAAGGCAPFAQAQSESAPRTGTGQATARSGANQLPALGDGGELTTSAERKLGDRIAREIYRDPDYIDDPILAEYVQEVWQPLLVAARSRGDLSDEIDQRFSWEILLGKDRTINAFALPGGYLGLHLGLIAAVSSRDELASVLAHELSHVTQRHISRLMSKQNAQTPWMVGAMILGALAASKSPDAANALMMGGQALAIQNQLNFSRDMEREADRVGFGVMTQAGFAPQGFVTMFDKLQQAARLNDNGSFPYLRSHPMTTERIADMQARQPAGVAAGPVVEPRMDHAMLSARARVLSNSSIDALRAAVAEAGSPLLANAPAWRQAAVLYAAALADTRMRDFQGAQAWLARLSALARQADDRARRQVSLLAVETALAAGQPVADPPAGKGRPDLLLGARVLVARGRAVEASSGLQTWVAGHPRDAGAWQALAAAYAAQGQALRAVRAEAEAQVAMLDYAAALDRFKAAQGMVRSAPGGAGVDHIEASIIDTRTRQVQLLVREQALER